MPGEWFVTGGYPCQPFSTAARGRNNAEDLWPETRRLITLLDTRYVIAENVSKKAIEKARDDIGGQIHRISAAALGAPHYRKRYFLVANFDSYGQSRGTEYEEMADIRCFPKMDEWQEEPTGILGMDVRLSHRMDRLKCLGNAIVPQCAEMIFRQIADVEKARLDG